MRRWLWFIWNAPVYECIPFLNELRGNGRAEHTHSPSHSGMAQSRVIFCVGKSQIKASMKRHHRTDLRCSLVYDCEHKKLRCLCATLLTRTYLQRYSVLFAAVWPGVSLTFQAAGIFVLRFCWPSIKYRAHNYVFMSAHRAQSTSYIACGIT